MPFELRDLLGSGWRGAECRELRFARNWLLRGRSQFDANAEISASIVAGSGYATQGDPADSVLPILDHVKRSDSSSDSAGGLKGLQGTRVSMKTVSY
jgi:hypothetical protein